MSALTGLRIVELADFVAGEYCRKLLADFGAEVIKVEPPGCGSGTRAMAPVLSEGCEAGGLFAYLNTNKQSVVLDAGRLDRLIGTADAVIEDRATDRSAQHPDVVFCSITRRQRGARRIRHRPEHQRLPGQWLGISHAQPCRPRQAAPAGAGPIPGRLRSGAGRGAVHRVVAVRPPAHRPRGGHRRLAAGGAGVARRLHTGAAHHRGGARRGRPRGLRPGRASGVLRPG